jgi:hypothetical protein
LTQRIEHGDFLKMKKTLTPKIDLDLENSIFSHDRRLRGALSLADSACGSAAQ